MERVAELDSALGLLSWEGYPKGITTKSSERVEPISTKLRR